ncbi:MAG: hypothetical protein ABSA05_07250 [Opitutaceae bacterium]
MAEFKDRREDRAVNLSFFTDRGAIVSEQGDGLTPRARKTRQEIEELTELAAQRAKMESERQAGRRQMRPDAPEFEERGRP